LPCDGLFENLTRRHGVMKRIKLAIAGVGNCASALLQGIEFYRNCGTEGEAATGLVFKKVGEYGPGDIEVVAAFDVDARKVGKKLKEAVLAPPNCTTLFYPDLPDYPVEVLMGPRSDGVASHMHDYPDEVSFVPSDREPCDVARALRESGADMLINYVPVGSEKAARLYAEACLDAGIAFINAMPVFIASDPAWATRFEEKGIPVVGDDIKSQVGATIIHRTLARLLEDRGARVERTYQLNFGGNTDFLNMLNGKRLASKKISKTQSVQSQFDVPLEPDSIHIGPSDYVPWLKDTKVCYIRMEGRGFGNVPLEVELRLSVEDSPNSAGVVIDAVRCTKLALDRGIGGALTSISSYAMKSPPEQHRDPDAKKMVVEFIAGRRER